MSSHLCEGGQPCAVPPHPDVQHLVADHFDNLQSQVVGSPSERPLGLNDGTLFEPARFPPNIPKAIISQAAQREPNLRGAVNVIVVLVNFKNKVMNQAAHQYFSDLFFSKQKIPTGSVTEYYNDISGGKISITGDVVGPFELPQTVEYYAHDGHGMKGPALLPDATGIMRNIQTMGNDTVSAVEAARIDLKKYDNKGRAKGYVDAFIIVHAGRGGEDPGNGKPFNVNDLWSCKWNLPGDDARVVGPSKTRVYPFLTIPENVKLGVCAHEIGHLVFGWPDLYDISGKSRGIGKWCLMAGGSWGAVGNGEPGTTPCHPSAWCKLDQGWIDALVDAADSDIFLNDVKANVSNTVNANRFGYVHKLWSNGQATGTEYFLVENRTKSGYDGSLPGEGLLVWHIDDLVPNNDDTLPHYKVALMNADGAAKLRGDGDATNPFPGTLDKRDFSATTLPNSKSYAGQDTFVSVRKISDAGRTMKMKIAVKPQTNNSGRTSKL